MVFDKIIHGYVSELRDHSGYKGMTGLFETLINEGDKNEYTKPVYLDAFLECIFDYKEFHKPTMEIEDKLNPRRIHAVKLDLDFAIDSATFLTLAISKSFTLESDIQVNLFLSLKHTTRFNPALYIMAVYPTF